MSGYTEYEVTVFPKGFFERAGTDDADEVVYAFRETYALFSTAKWVAREMAKTHDVRVTKRTVTLEDMDFMEGEE